MIRCVKLVIFVALFGVFLYFAMVGMAVTVDSTLRHPVPRHRGIVIPNKVWVTSPVIK